MGTHKDFRSHRHFRTCCMDFKQVSAFAALTRSAIPSLYCCSDSICSELSLWLPLIVSRNLKSGIIPLGKLQRAFTSKCPNKSRVITYSSTLEVSSCESNLFFLSCLVRVLAKLLRVFTSFLTLGYRDKPFALRFADTHCGVVCPSKKVLILLANSIQRNASSIFSFASSQGPVKF